MNGQGLYDHGPGGDEDKLLGLVLLMGVEAALVAVKHRVDAPGLGRRRLPPLPLGARHPTLSVEMVSRALIGQKSEQQPLIGQLYSHLSPG